METSKVNSGATQPPVGRPQPASEPPRPSRIDHHVSQDTIERALGRDPTCWESFMACCLSPLWECLKGICAYFGLIGRDPAGGAGRVNTPLVPNVVYSVTPDITNALTALRPSLYNRGLKTSDWIKIFQELPSSVKRSLLSSVNTKLGQAQEGDLRKLACKDQDLLNTTSEAAQKLATYIAQHMYARDSKDERFVETAFVSWIERQTLPRGYVNLHSFTRRWGYREIDPARDNGVWRNWLDGLSQEHFDRIMTEMQKNHGKSPAEVYSQVGSREVCGIVIQMRNAAADPLDHVLSFLAKRGDYRLEGWEAAVRNLPTEPQVHVYAHIIKAAPAGRDVEAWNIALGLPNYPKVMDALGEWVMSKYSSPSSPSIPSQEIDDEEKMP